MNKHSRGFPSKERTESITERAREINGFPLLLEPEHISWNHETISCNKCRGFFYVRFSDEARESLIPTLNQMFKQHIHPYAETIEIVKSYDRTRT